MASMGCLALLDGWHTLRPAPPSTGSTGPGSTSSSGRRTSFQRPEDEVPRPCCRHDFAIVWVLTRGRMAPRGGCTHPTGALVTLRTVPRFDVSSIPARERGGHDD